MKTLSQYFLALSLSATHIPKNFLAALGVYAQGKMDRFRGNNAIITSDFDSNSVKENSCIKRIQRTVLPFFNLRKDGVRNIADKFGTGLHTVFIIEKALNFPG